ncbi:MAG: hypothetical protein GX969_04625 [Firmicutes bacterium]|nr:hypothetical protein [Bacillota bacterium]
MNGRFCRLKCVIHISLIRTCILVTLISLLSFFPVYANTGTFKITDYDIEIIPRADGSWTANYRQEWEVLTGNAPWVTVGLPNVSYEITQWTGCATAVKPDNQGAWSGALVQLNRTYQKGETFNFGFTVIQSKVAYPKDNNNIEFSFTPGWYDDIAVERMVITLKNPWPERDIKFISPEPYEKTDNKIVWVSKLNPGQRFNINFVFPSQVFNEFDPDRELKTWDEFIEFTDDNRAPTSARVIIPVVIIALILIYIAILKKRSKIYKGRRGIFYGSPRPLGAPFKTYPGSKQSKQSNKTSDGSNQGNSKKSGGGGGFGGRSTGCACVSCACACVSCACACACAGGRGAGCTQKFSRLDEIAKEDKEDQGGGVSRS